MIKNLQDYFSPEQEIFLDTIDYKKIEYFNNQSEEISLLCQDNVKVSSDDNGVRIIITRTLTFEPEQIFSLSVSFGTDLKFNERKSEHDWSNINLAEEFRKNGDFITIPLLSRISLLVGQITSSFGQQPLILPAALAKDNQSENL